MKIRSLYCDVIFVGQGIVNREGTSKTMIPGAGLQDTLKAKKYGEKPFVSRDCILHEVLEEPFGFKLLSQSPADIDRMEVNLSPWRMLRGNLDASAGSTIRRKSPLMMTDAYPTDNCDDIYIASHAKGNMGGVFYSEDVNKVELCSKVAIDLSALQFISTDSQLSFPAIPADVFKNVDPRVQDIWARYYPNTPIPSPAYFTKGKTQFGAEHSYQTEGVKLSTQDTLALVDFLFERIQSFHLQKKNSFLKFDRIANIVLVTEQGKIAVDSIDQLSAQFVLNNITDIDSQYVETTKLFDYSVIRAHIEKSKDESKEEKEKVKAEKKTKKNAAKDDDAVEA